MTNTLFVGANWICKYLIGKMLLDDQDEEDNIVVFDTTQTINEFFNFPPLQQFAGDERITVANTMNIQKAIKEYGPFDSVIIDTNVIQEVHDLIEIYSSPYHISPIPKFFVISSWEVYGWKGRRKMPISEEEKCEPTTQLGQTKLAIENMVSYAFPCRRFRLSTIFGPYMPENEEIMQWLMNLIISKPVIVGQPAGRKLDMCYVYNVLAPIQKALESSVQTPSIINLGSADSDFQADGKLNVFEKNVVDTMKGVRVLIDSHSQLSASDEDVEQYQGKGYHSQLKTELARKYLDYFPMVDTLKGFLQTCTWLQKRMELDPQFAPYVGREIEEIYPTLDDKKVFKTGEEFKNREVEDIKERLYEERKIKDKMGKEIRADLDEKSLLCDRCKHVPMTISEGCKCSCHSPYLEKE